MFPNQTIWPMRNWIVDYGEWKTDVLKWHCTPMIIIIFELHAPQKWHNFDSKTLNVSIINGEKLVLQYRPQYQTTEYIFRQTNTLLIIIIFHCVWCIKCNSFHIFLFFIKVKYIIANNGIFWTNCHNKNAFGIFFPLYRRGWWLKVPKSATSVNMNAYKVIVFDRCDNPSQAKFDTWNRNRPGTT